MSGENSTAIVASTTAAAVPVPAPATAPPRCANCANELHGEYCSHCGQRVEPHIHSLWGFMQEAAESITHADSRVWRTIVPLLIRPGFLTREFLDGRRARYLPPFRLYLVLSVIFFLVVSFEGRKTAVIAPETGADVAAAMADVQDEVAAARTEKVASTGEGTAALAKEGTCENLRYEGPAESWVRPRLKPICEKIRADGGEGMSEAFKHNMPRAMFVFLPLLAGVMKLLYWRPKRWYVEHLLLFVHNHAFAFLAFALVSLLALPFGGALEGIAILALMIYVPWYVYRSMRVVYRQSRLLTLAKMAVLSIAYVGSLIVMIVVTTIYSIATL